MSGCVGAALHVPIGCLRRSKAKIVATIEKTRQLRLLPFAAVQLQLTVPCNEADVPSATGWLCAVKKPQLLLTPGALVCASALVTRAGVVVHFEEAKNSAETADAAP